ncbi:hypothetical protein VTJ49DRAFT_4363 [Mycothermus thermophilus]|uniref:Kelch repeat-containing protein n=1 Tax=Humicola insolens TaxID=85995 RepID=A0ABR3VMS1_HUMIN
MEARSFAQRNVGIPPSFHSIVMLGEGREHIDTLLDPVKDFCRRFGHQTAVIDRKLYIDGGFINYNPLSQYPANYTNTRLLYHDLDTPGEGRMPQLYANLTKNSSIPSVNGGTLWADTLNKRFYLFGGEYHQHPPSQEFTLWSYDTIYEKWDSFGSPPQDEYAAVSYGAGVAVPETGMGYYYGGWKSNNTVPGWTGPPKAVPWLVKYNMDQNTWSTDPGPDEIGRAEGVMTFIPIGDGGMLVYLGGLQDPYGNGTWVPQPTDTILLYDVLSSKWYTQNATGTVPASRRRFCGGATWAPDQSSYNIYIYGGAGVDPDHAAFDDIYVLTIPTFQWIKMHPTDGNVTGEYPHHSLSCNIIDGAQMVIIGGTFPTLDMCDSPPQFGLHNADLGQQNPDKALWEIFNPNLTQYAVPDAIIDAVGGSPTGGATKTAPADGFSNPDLSVLMTRKARLPNRTPTRPPTPVPEPDGDSSLSTGAIAGIAVGSAVALLAFLAGIYLLIRRRRESNGGVDKPGFPPGSPQTWNPDTPVTSPYSHSSSPYQVGAPFIPAKPIELPLPLPSRGGKLDGVERQRWERDV